jgi:hypothetical protein
MKKSRVSVGQSDLIFGTALLIVTLKCSTGGLLITQSDYDRTFDPQHQRKPPLHRYDTLHPCGVVH